jgi:Mg/Co/Ni transporter MgtE
MRVGPIAVRIEHLLVIAVAVIVGAVVLFYSGDADPLIAVESGLGAGLVIYLAAYLRSRYPFQHRR